MSERRTRIDQDGSVTRKTPVDISDENPYKEPLAEFHLVSGGELVHYDVTFKSVRDCFVDGAGTDWVIGSDRLVNLANVTHVSEVDDPRMFEWEDKNARGGV